MNGFKEGTDWFSGRLLEFVTTNHPTALVIQRENIEALSNTQIRVVDVQIARVLEVHINVNGVYVITTLPLIVKYIVYIKDDCIVYTPKLHFTYKSGGDGKIGYKLYKELFEILRCPELRIELPEPVVRFIPNLDISKLFEESNTWVFVSEQGANLAAYFSRIDQAMNLAKKEFRLRNQNQDK